MAKTKHLTTAALVCGIAALTPGAAQAAGVQIVPVGGQAGPIDLGVGLFGQATRTELELTNDNDQPVALEGTTQSVTTAERGIFGVEPGTCAPAAGVAPGAVCRFTLLWKPFAVGPTANDLFVAVKNPVTDEYVEGTTIDVRGGGRAFAAPDQVDLGAATVGTIGPGHAVTLETFAPDWLGPRRVHARIEGPDADDFATARDECTGRPFDDRCALQVRFAPSAPGPRSALLVLTDEASGDVRRVPLSGVGAAAAPAPRSTLSGPSASPTPTTVVVRSVQAAATRPATFGVAAVTCRVTRAHRRVCDVALARGFTGVRYRLLRGSRVLARGTLTAARPRVTLPRRLEAGRYVLRFQHGGAAVRRTITVR